MLLSISLMYSQIQSWFGKHLYFVCSQNYCYVRGTSHTSKSGVNAHGTHASSTSARTRTTGTILSEEGGACRRLWCDRDWIGGSWILCNSFSWQKRTKGTCMRKQIEIRAATATSQHTWMPIIVYPFWNVVCYSWLIKGRRVQRR